jgi:hypothetical protein
VSVWVCLPSARPVDEVDARMDKWRHMGYSIAMVRDEDRPYPRTHFGLTSKCQWGKYPGYAVAMNALTHVVLDIDRKCDWVVIAADDIDPDLARHADDIAGQCSRYFGGEMGTTHSTFGVMQPTGDRWGDGMGAYVDRVAGSPWIGREFARRVYGGEGPYWPEYTHMGVDEELQHVALKYGVFWQRPDLIHFHDHWGRARAGEKLGQRSRMPAFLEHANSPEEWRRYKGIFQRRQAAGFPGSELRA